MKVDPALELRLSYWQPDPTWEAPLPGEVAALPQGEAAVLFLYGIEYAYNHEALLPWLTESNTHYVVYLEDDIILNDPDFFLKLRLFNQTFGNRYLLMPNRIETLESSGQLRRFYIDGNYNPAVSSQYRKSTDARFSIMHLGERVQFEQPSNLHSGCFFLTNSQLTKWSESSNWLNYDVSFVSPLESAATLGIAQNFNILKTPFSHASWFELQHFGTSFHSLIGGSAPIP